MRRTTEGQGRIRFAYPCWWVRPSFEEIMCAERRETKPAIDAIWEQKYRINRKRKPTQADRQTLRRLAAALRSLYAPKSSKSLAL